MLNFNTHSVYSYKKAIAQIKEIAKVAKDNGENSFCITDTGSMKSFVKAFFAAEELGMKFIPGYEALVKPDDSVYKIAIDNKIGFYRKQMNLKRTTDEMRDDFQKKIDFLESINSVVNHSLILIAKNQQGLENMFESFNHETEVDGVYLNSNENILTYKDGLIFLTGGQNSEIMYYILNDELEKAEYIMSEYKNILGENYYCQIEYSPFLANAYNDMIKIARKLDIPLVATNNANYAYENQDGDYHMYRNVMFLPESKINHNEYIMSKDELREKMLTIYDKEAVDSAINNISVIDNLCEKTKFPRAEGLIDCSEELTELCKKGWEKLRKGTEYEEESLTRFKYELEVINGKNFSQYFIKVLNIVNLAHKLGILIGPARGSGAGSEICYLIGITQIDPLKYGLYFERFLNPGRKGMPDIDLDMASIPVGYDFSIELDTDEESSENEVSASRNLLVSKLLELGYFKFAGYIHNEVTASALVLFKNLAKYYDIPFQEVNKISTCEEYALELKKKEYTGWLKKAVNQFDLEWEDVWDVIEKKIGFCYRLAGIPQNSSVAASGVVMTSSPAKLPVRDGAIAANGSDLESLDYIKFDLLSINTLNQIQNFDGLDVEWNKNDDANVWETIQRGDTDFVFQFSSPGMKHILKNAIKPIYKDVVSIEGLGNFDYNDYIELIDGQKIKAKELYDRIQNGEEFEIKD